MKNKQTRELAVCGLSAVRAILACRPGCVRRLFFLPDLLPEFRPLLRAFAGRRALYRMVPEEDLERLSGTVHHQGAVAMIDQPEIPILDAATARAWAGRGERILVLDGLANDHNLGAIARSAAFFGVRNLLLAGTSGPDLVTTSAFRVAEGGMEW
ncbi:MAG TPA: RNA methyltransferase substrate-binding domain-containing protein, partial [Magnetospirillaceae bacterium]|nr:RNA methyltransferase substrate-binding domain-containing protein [Magnetospirillaceae bacterium]